MSVTNLTSSLEFLCFLALHVQVVAMQDGDLHDALKFCCLDLSLSFSPGLSLSLSLSLSAQPVKADDRPPSSLVCPRFLPVKGEFFLAIVAKCLLMGECWVSLNVKSLVSTCSICKVS